MCSVTVKSERPADSNLKASALFCSLSFRISSTRLCLDRSSKSLQNTFKGGWLQVAKWVATFEALHRFRAGVKHSRRGECFYQPPFAEVVLSCSLYSKCKESYEPNLHGGRLTLRLKLV